MEVALFEQDMRKRGWKSLEGDGDVLREIANDLVLTPCLRPGEGMIGGELLLERSRELGARFGQIAAGILLWDQSKIPADWRRGRILFPRTIWLDCDGNRRMPAWRWAGEMWEPYFYNLGNALLEQHNAGVLLRPRPQQLPLRF